jgi:nucleotide-binding universal stress UspA family protein
MERAILLAHDLAPARAGLLHVAPASPLPAFSRKPDGHDGRQTAATRIRALARHVQERTGLRVDTRVVVGKVVPTLREFASEADLTIVAGPPARPLRDLTIGSPVQRLSRRLERPLLVVNQPARQSYRQVVVAVDLSNDPGNALAAARALAPGAKLNLLHVYRAPYEGQLRYAGASEEAIYSHRAEARTSAASALTTLVLSHLPADEVRLLLAHGHPLPKLLEKTCDVGADLIVVTRSEPSLMRELLVESVTEAGSLLSDHAARILE